MTSDRMPLAPTEALARIRPDAPKRRRSKTRRSMPAQIAACMVAVGSTLLITGCAGDRYNSPMTQQQGGMVVGGLMGGLLGAQVGEGSGRTAATIVGTLLGAAIGGNVGRSMDDGDRLKTAHTLETVRSGVQARWRNPDTGNEFTVTPQRSYDTAQGPCREYEIQALIAHRMEGVQGTACRQADGTWRVVN